MTDRVYSACGVGTPVHAFRENMNRRLELHTVGLSLNRMVAQCTSRLHLWRGREWLVPPDVHGNLGFHPPLLLSLSTSGRSVLIIPDAMHSGVLTTERALMPLWIRGSNKLRIIPCCSGRPLTMQFMIRFDAFKSASPCPRRAQSALPQDLCIYP